jgi:hypothetical protein
VQAWDEPLRHSSVAWGPIQLPKSCFRCSIERGRSSSFRRSSSCSQRRSGWAAVKFFSFFSLLSHALKIHVWPLKKQLCPQVCSFIDFDNSSFNYYLFDFWCLLKLVFFRFHSRHFIKFDFFIWFGPSIFYCSISVFYTFLDYYFFLQSHPLSFYCIYFFNLFFVFILLIAIFL